MRLGVSIAVLFVLTGCSFGQKKTNQADASRIDRCTQRFLARLNGSRPSGMQSYVQSTYCEPFARKGWVYADGTLSIKAHLYVLHGGACAAATSTPGGPTSTIPCDPRAALSPLDCAILHYVRREEVRAYIRKLKRSQTVRCDDGTPLDKLGAA